MLHRDTPDKTTHHRHSPHSGQLPHRSRSSVTHSLLHVSVPSTPDSSSPTNSAARDVQRTGSYAHLGPYLEVLQRPTVYRQCSNSSHTAIGESQESFPQSSSQGNLAHHSHLRLAPHSPPQARSLIRNESSRRFITSPLSPTLPRYD